MRMVALMRGVNVGSNRKVSMPALCAAATKAGLASVKSYINSGNLVFNSDSMNTAQAAVLLETLIKKKFGFETDVIIRTAPQWEKYIKKNPFPSAAQERASLLLLGLCKNPCNKNAVSQLSEHATQGEKIKIVGDALWVDFVKSVGNSKLTPALFDKAAGSTVTMRNWNTLLKIHEILDNETDQT